MPYFFLIASMLLSSVHILALRPGNKRQGLATVTKPFLIPSLFVTFYSFALELGVDISSIHLIFIALLFYTLGDILLEIDRKVFFYMGMLSFLLGHFTYIAFFVSLGIKVSELLVAGIIWLFGLGLGLKKVIDFKDRRSIIFILYASVIAILGTVIGGADFSGHWIAQIIAFFGAISFAFSDSLILVRMNRNSDEDQLIMFTYVAANFLILAAILLLEA